MEKFVGWLANKRTPYVSYHAFMSGRLIALVKQPVVRPVRVRENRRRLFAKILLWVTVTKATSACQDDHMCDGIKEGIYCSVHGVKSIWDTNSTKEDWEFLLIEKKMRSTRSIESKYC